MSRPQSNSLRPLFIKPLAKWSTVWFTRNGTQATHRIIDLHNGTIVTQSATRTHSWSGTYADFRSKFTKTTKETKDKHYE